MPFPEISKVYLTDKGCDCVRVCARAVIIAILKRAIQNGSSEHQGTVGICTVTKGVLEQDDPRLARQHANIQKCIATHYYYILYCFQQKILHIAPLN